MTLEHHRCQPGQDRAGFSHAIHHLPIYHRCTIAPSSSKPPLARGHHCTGAPRRPISICYHLTGSTSTSLTSRCGGPLALAILGVPWPHLLTPRPPTTPSRAAPLPATPPSPSRRRPSLLHRVGRQPHRPAHSSCLLPARRLLLRASPSLLPPPTAISHASPLMPPPRLRARSKRRGRSRHGRIAVAATVAANATGPLLPSPRLDPMWGGARSRCPASAGTPPRCCRLFGQLPPWTCPRWNYGGRSREPCYRRPCRPSALPATPSSGGEARDGLGEGGGSGGG